LCREALLWKHLDHPSILPFRGVCQAHPGHQFWSLVTPWREKGEISTYLRVNGTLPNVRKLASVYQLATGVRYLHAKNVVHGDLTGANVLLTDTYDIQICDFGQGRWIEQTLLPTTEAQGTPLYMAPELFFPNQRATTASDVYGFACVAFEMRCGKPPFHNNNHYQVKAAHDARQQQSRPSGVPDRLWELIQECWSYDPDARPSMERVVSTIEEWGWGRSIQGR
ncbi:kinase-like domain-containing protein, partial [Mycena filopes]